MPGCARHIGLCQFVACRTIHISRYLRARVYLLVAL